MVILLEIDAPLFFFPEPSNVSDLKLNPHGSSISISWTKPVGHYQNFSIELSPGNHEKNTQNLQIEFSDLKAGALYTVKVIVNGFGGLKSRPEEKSIYTCKYHNCTFVFFLQ